MRSLRWALPLASVLATVPGCHRPPDDPPLPPAPTVTASLPAPDATFVEVGSPVSVTFTLPLAAATVDAASFLISSAAGPVAGAVTSSDATATFTPSAPLANEVEYTARVTTAVTSSAGVPLAAEHSFRFTTVPVARFAYVLDFPDASLSLYAIDARSGRLIRRGHVPVRTLSNGLTLHPRGTFAYVSNFVPGSPTTGTVRAYSVDPDTGALALVGEATTPAAAGPAVVHPTLGYVYAVTGTDVAAFAVDPSTGALSAITGSPFALGVFPQTLLFHPAGKVLLAPLSSGIGAFTVSATTGALSPVNGSPFGGGARSSLALSPGGQFLYAVDPGAGGLYAYAVDATAGTVAAAGGPYAAGAGAGRLRFDVAGRVAFSLDGNALAAFSVDPASGALSPLAGSPAALPGAPTSLSVDPRGRFAVVAIGGSPGILSFPVQAGTLETATSYDAGANASAVDVDPAGTRVLARTASGLTLFDADAAGVLARVMAPRTRHGGTALAFGRGQAPASCSPAYAYVANSGSHDVSVMAVAPATGALGAATSFALGAGAAPTAVSVDPLGRRAFVAENGGNLAELRIDAASGGLTALATAAISAGPPRSVAGDPSGTLVFAIRGGTLPAGDGPLAAFSLDAGGGTLSSLGANGFLVGSGAYTVTLDPTGRYAFLPTGTTCSLAGASISSSGFPSAIAGSPWALGVSCMGTGAAAVDGTGTFAFGVGDGPTGSVAAFSIDPSTGALTGTDGKSSLPAGAISVAADPFGQYAYVFLRNGKILPFAVSAAGTLTQLLSVGAGSAGGTLAMDPTGQYLYATDGAGGVVHAFAVSRSTGQLSPIAGSPFTAGTTPLSIAVSAVCR